MSRSWWIVSVGSVHGETGGTPRHDQFVAHLKARVPATAGPHPLGSRSSRDRHRCWRPSVNPIRLITICIAILVCPAVYEVSVTGPYASIGAGDTASRRTIFVAKPRLPRMKFAASADSDVLVRRRMVGRCQSDLERPMAFFANARRAARTSNPASSRRSARFWSIHTFCFASSPIRQGFHLTRRIDQRFGTCIAAVLFLWSSLPDDELLESRGGKLSRPDVLEHQTRRMLADARAVVDRELCQPVVVPSQSRFVDARLAAVS